MISEEIILVAAENTPPAIITVQYGSFWSASVHGDADKWKSGDTRAEAVGKLHLAYPGLFGAVLAPEETKQ